MDQRQSFVDHDYQSYEGNNRDSEAPKGFRKPHQADEPDGHGNDEPENQQQNKQTDKTRDHVETFTFVR